MALTVEDGTIVSGAESYCTLAFANTYHAARGNALTWTEYTDEDREDALRKATDYMLQKYTERWAGYRKSSSQVLDWPRSYVPINDLVAREYISDSIVPDEVKRACASLALRALTTDLLADEEQRVVREKVDVIETEYSEHASQRKKYPEIDLMLRRYLAFGEGSLNMIRVA